MKERKIVEYRLVGETYNHKTDERRTAMQNVNSLIDAGWQPYGSALLDGVSEFVQPMVRYEES